ncbi:ABC transporter permease subunit [Anaerocolumna sp. AGMB13025]|uniref:ABC transporter permease n=1 Tax=Anaerocolumna sp. AGMB13025 TaxID=3039116 RepID=UPI00241D2529|nr:ABC transporter permease subunit [Anaerocolumna sp. AGMB13025]WFR57628.1 ABC transporter permease subunit [Anaerocolumna sp. AGMB13025]
MAKTVTAAGSSYKKNKNLAQFKRCLPLYFMALPGIIYLFINNYMPLPGLVLAFKKFNARKGIFGSDWAGLSNFKYLFTTQDAFIITRNTILYNLTFIVINTVCAIAVAIILAELTSKVKKFYQSAILLPFLISAVIISYLVFAFLSTENGFVNNSILKPFGIEGISWYTEKKYWPFILILVNTWKTVGYNCIIYLSTIVGFDRAYYEAASIDGASKWQQLRRITIPLLKPTIIMLTLLSIGRIFYSDFGLFYQVPQNSGALYSVTNTIDTYVYRGLLELGDITMSSAAGLYQSVIGFILVLSANLIVRKVDSENALF